MATALFYFNIIQIEGGFYLYYMYSKAKMYLSSVSHDVTEIIDVETICAA